MNALRGESGPGTVPAGAPRRRRWRRLVLLALALLAVPWIPHLVLALGLRYANTLVNGTLDARSLSVGLRDRTLTIAGPTGSPPGDATSAVPLLFQAEQVTVRLAGWTDPRPVEVIVDHPVLYVDLRDGARDWFGFWKGTGEPSTGPPELPALITVTGGDLRLRTDTDFHKVEFDAAARTADHRTAVDLTFTHDRGDGRVAGTYDLARGAVEQATAHATWTGIANAVLAADLAFEYSPDTGLTVREAHIGDGIDTVAAWAVWQDTRTAELRLEAYNFDFGARYPELADFRGDALEVSLNRISPGDDRFFLDAAWRDHRVGGVSVTARIDPARLAVDDLNLLAEFPETGKLTATGDIRYETEPAVPPGPGRVIWDGVAVELPRYGVAVSGLGGAYVHANGDLSYHLSEARYGTVRTAGISGHVQLYPDRYEFNAEGSAAGGRVEAVGRYLPAIGSGTARVEAAGLELPALDRMLQAQLAGTGISLESGRLDGAVEVGWGRSWSARSTAPVRVTAAAVKAGAYGSVGIRSASAGFDLRPGRLVVGDGRVVLADGGVLELAGELAGADYGRLRSARLRVADLDLKPVAGLLARCCRPKAVLAQIQGKVGCDLQLAAAGDTGIVVGGSVVLADVAAQFSEPNIVVRKLAGALAVDTTLVHLPAMAEVLRAEFDAAWAQRAVPFTGNLTCKSVTLGSIKLSDMVLGVSVNWPRLRVDRARWKLFGGDCAAEGDINFDAGIYGLSVLARSISLKTLCAAFPAAANNLQGKVNAIVYLQGSDLTLLGMSGRADAWAYADAEEPMQVNREFLVNLGGEQVAKLPIGQVDALPFHVGELTVRIGRGTIRNEGGEPVTRCVMDFEKLSLQVRSLLYTVNVGVAPGNERIEILKFFRSIDLLSTRGVEVQFGGNRPPA